MVATMLMPVSATLRCTPVNGDMDRRPNQHRMASDNCEADVRRINAAVAGTNTGPFSCYTFHHDQLGEGTPHIWRSCPWWDNTDCPGFVDEDNNRRPDNPCTCYNVQYVMAECPESRGIYNFTERDASLTAFNEAAGVTGFMCGHHRRFRNDTDPHDEGTYSIAVRSICRETIVAVNARFGVPPGPTMPWPTRAPVTRSPTVAPSMAPVIRARCNVPTVDAPLSVFAAGGGNVVLEGDAIQLSCEGVHHELVGNPRPRCMRSGNFQPLGLCVHLQCSAQSIQAPEHGSIVDLVTDDVNSGQTITFECNPGYTLRGTSSMSCMGTSWIGEIPSCEALLCSSEISVEHGDMVFDSISSEGNPLLGSTALGTQVNVSCQFGFAQVGSMGECMLNEAMAVWESVPGCQPIMCSAPEVLGSPGVSISQNQATYEYGMQITLSCSAGYASNTKVITCGIGAGAVVSISGFQHRVGTVGGWISPGGIEFVCEPNPLPSDYPVVEDATLMPGQPNPSEWATDTELNYECSNMDPTTRQRVVKVYFINLNDTAYFWDHASRDFDGNPLECPTTISPTTSTPTSPPTTSPPTSSSMNIGNSSPLEADAVSSGTITIVVVITVVIVILIAAAAAMLVIRRNKSSDTERETSFDNPMYDSTPQYDATGAATSDTGNYTDVSPDFRPNALEGPSEENTGYMDVLSNTNSASGYMDDDEDDEDV